MKELAIVGAGLGPETLTAAGRAALDEAEVWFGAPRLLELYAGIRAGKEAWPFYQAGKIREVIDSTAAARYAVLVSGDTGFYSAASGLGEDLGEYHPRFVPGVSSMNAFFARLGRPWQNAALWSAHGREGAASSLTGLVRRSRETFCLGGSPAELGRALCGAGFDDLTVHGGENLGTKEERIYAVSAAGLSRRESSGLCVFLVVNENPDDSIPAGIADGAFLRSNTIPMTKSAIRAAVLSRLALKSSDTVYDIGAGTGSVTVEAALAAWRGQVYAVEREESAPPLIRENCRRFHLGNVTVVQGDAPEALRELPPPDAVFIGGSGGSMGAIISVVREKNPLARIVATAIAIETAAELLSLLPGASLVQIAAAEGRELGGENRKLHLLMARNPVMIISSVPADSIYAGSISAEKTLGEER